MNDLIFTYDYFYDEVREGFFISEMMKRYWASQLEVLRTIDRICQNHNINWYANYGTLLGAVRHKGFIPWDDDIDITMLRDDYDKFFDYAKKELPDGYCILNTSEQCEYYYPFGRITNSHSINMNPEFLENFHGCPYVTGVDIYPYDKLFSDDSREEARDMRGVDIFQALSMAITPGINKKGLDRQLTKIERENNFKIDRNKDIRNQLGSLLEKLSLEAADDDSEDVALLYSWMRYKHNRLSLHFFDDYIEMPFENTTVRGPIGYDEILKVHYSDYSKVIRSGGEHEYPVYKEQEKIYKKEKGSNPFRYTLRPGDIPKQRKHMKMMERCEEILALLSSMHKYFPALNQKGMEDDLAELLKSCQNSAVVLGNMVEDKFKNYSTELVIILEKYCDSIYELSLGLDEDKIEACDKLIDQANNEITKLFSAPVKDILFLPCRIQWWDSMKSVFEGAIANGNNVNIIPIPHFDCDFTGNIGEIHNNAEDFDSLDELKDYITTFDEYGLEKRHPDVIVIQVPFDNYSNSIAIPQILLSENLLQYTDELAYVPCFDTLIPESDNDPIIASLKPLIEQPTVINTDRIILKHPKIKDIYIKTLIELSGIEYSEYWSNKILLQSEVNWLKAPLNTP